MSRNPPEIPATPLPAHLAVIMDGNGRWAQQRGRARAVGHRMGVRAAQRLIEAAIDRDIPVLSIFAFSQENWYRPEREVRLLLRLFSRTLRIEMERMQEHGIRLSFIGNRDRFPPSLQEQMALAEAETRDNRRMRLIVALGYGGQWDIATAAESLRCEGAEITVEAIMRRVATADVAPPDLLIRTGGECRVSNFMLWQLAYTELLFTETLWPDFDAAALDEALAWFAGRQRRFGRVEDKA